MVNDSGHNICCPTCGRPIEDPGSTFRCPACGSYEVARAAGHRPGSTRNNLPSVTEVDEEPVALAAIYPLRFLLPRPPRGVPRACWERVRRLRLFLALAEFLWIGCCVGALLLNVSGVRPSLYVYDRLWYPVLFLSIVGSIAFPRLLRRSIRQFEREIRSNSLEHCLECGYPLRGLPAEHRCPECGQPYRMDAVRRTWERYLKAQEPTR